jgi:restriction system protein
MKKDSARENDGPSYDKLTVWPGQDTGLDVKQLRGAMKSLSPEQREALILVHASGFSYEEAAQICGCAVSTIKSRVGRGRSRLDEILSVEGRAAKPQLLLQAVVVPGDRTNEGKLIEAVTIPWFDIIALLAQDPNIAFQIPPEKWEEIVAGAYCKADFDEVILTPRSGDHGRDVIAIKKGLGSIRVIDQVKAFKPSHLVDADDVRALMGVLQTDGASKGFLTTTSDFAPKIRTDPLIVPLIPKQLELVNGTMLMRRLQELAARDG